jgi:hypothetical protein
VNSQRKKKQKRKGNSNSIISIKSLKANLKDNEKLLLFCKFPIVEELKDRTVLVLSRFLLLNLQLPSFSVIDDGPTV